MTYHCLWKPCCTHLPARILHVHTVPRRTAVCLQCVERGGVTEAVHNKQSADVNRETLLGRCVPPGLWHEVPCQLQCHMQSTAFKPTVSLQLLASVEAVVTNMVHNIWRAADYSCRG